MRWTLLRGTRYAGRQREWDKFDYAPAFDPYYNIVSLDAIYNLTDDPTETVNLYSAYNTGTRVVTLTSSQDTDDALILYFTAKPSINIEMVSRDYYLPKPYHL